MVALRSLALLGLAGCAVDPPALRGVPDRPPLVNSLPFGRIAHPVGRGNTRLTVDGRHVSFPSEAVTGVSATATHGVFDRFELSARVPYLFRDPEGPEPSTDGVGDVAVGTLVYLGTAADWVLSAAVDVGLGTAERDKGLGREEIRTAPQFIASTQFGRYELLLGLGAVLESGVDSLFTYQLTGVRQLGDWRMVLQLSGESITGERDAVRLGPGLVWGFAEAMDIGVHVPIGLTSSAEDWGVVVQANAVF